MACGTWLHTWLSRGGGVERMGLRALEQGLCCWWHPRISPPLRSPGLPMSTPAWALGTQWEVHLLPPWLQWQSQAWKLDAHLCKQAGRHPLCMTAKDVAKGLRQELPSEPPCPDSHRGEAIGTSSGCDYKFNTKSNLSKHFERRHENQQEWHVCTFEGCKKAFKEHQQLRIHQCQHSSASATHKCAPEGYGKCFTSLIRLKLHGKIHRAECVKQNVPLWQKRGQSF